MLCMQAQALTSCACDFAHLRWMVYFVFPIFMTSVIILRGIVLFKRGKIADKQVGSTAEGRQQQHAHKPFVQCARVPCGVGWH